MSMIKQVLLKYPSKYFTTSFRTRVKLTRSYATASFDKPKPEACQHPVVNSHNEWDPLEEVIVGTARGAHLPPFDLPLKATSPKECWPLLEKVGATAYPKELIEAAEKELDNLCHILEQEGVTVKRPEVLDGDLEKSFKTPDFESRHGCYAVMPRDNLLVIGDTIVEAPMSWRCRFFEYRHYRTLIKDYFKAGANWVSPPKGTMSDELYNHNWKLDKSTSSSQQDADHEFCLTEHEPIFEAPDFTRFGRDIFYQLSHATNEFGVEWMKRTFPEYRFHRVSMANDTQAYHMDVTFTPLGPGKLLIDGAKPPFCGGSTSVGGWFEYDGKPTQYRLPAMFKGWDVFIAPRPHYSKEPAPYFSSLMVATSNVLMLDPQRVLVEANEPEVIKSFQRWGFKPVPVSIQNTLRFGGGFHCITCDIRRRGKLESYF